MKTWKKTVLAVSGCLIGVGAVCAGIGIARGGSIHYDINLKTGYTDYSADLNRETRTIQQLGDFDQLHLQLDSVDVRILPTEEDAPYIQTNLGENYLQWSVEDGVLSIQESQSVQERRQGRGIYGFTFAPPFLGFGSGSLNRENDTLTLYIPRGTRLKDSGIQCSYGDITVSQVAIEKLALMTDDGDISLKKLNCDTISLNSAYGNVSLDDISAGSLHVSLESGDCTSQTVEATELELRSSYGEAELEGGSVQTGTITMDSGDLLMSQLQVTERLDAENAYGDILFTSKDGADAYSYELTTEYGDVTVGGKDYPSGVVKEKENAPILCFRADSGDITVQ